MKYEEVLQIRLKRCQYKMLSNRKLGRSLLYGVELDKEAILLSKNAKFSKHNANYLYTNRKIKTAKCLFFSNIFFQELFLLYGILIWKLHIQNFSHKNSKIKTFAKIFSFKHFPNCTRKPKLEGVYQEQM